MCCRLELLSVVMTEPQPCAAMELVTRNQYTMPNLRELVIEGGILESLVPGGGGGGGGAAVQPPLPVGGAAVGGGQVVGPEPPLNAAAPYDPPQNWPWQVCSCAFPRATCFCNVIGVPMGV